MLLTRLVLDGSGVTSCLLFCPQLWTVALSLCFYFPGQLVLTHFPSLSTCGYAIPGPKEETKQYPKPLASGHVDAGT